MKNWKTVKLGEVLDILNGYAFNSKQFSADGDMPLIRIRDLANGAETQTRYTGDFDDKYLVNKGDMLVGMDGEFRCYRWKGDPALLNQRVCKLYEFSDNLDSAFVFYGINKHLKDIEDETGFTTVKHLSSRAVKEINFPLPPLEEQQRIVAILDAAFAAINTATANTQQVLANAREVFELFRTNLITQTLADIDEQPLENFCERFEYGTSSKSKPTGKVPVIRMGNLQNESIDWSDLVFSDNDDEIEKYSLEPLDVLFNRTNSAEHVGKTAIYRGEHPAIFAGYLVRVHMKRDELNPEFLNYYLNSRPMRDYGKSVMSRSVNQANISASKLKEYPIRVPNIFQQHRIVEQLDALSERTQYLATLAQTKLDRLDELKQSLLHQAFTGQLTQHARQAKAQVEAAV